MHDLHFFVIAKPTQLNVVKHTIVPIKTYMSIDNGEILVSTYSAKTREML